MLIRQQECHINPKPLTSNVFGEGKEHQDNQYMHEIPILYWDGSRELHLPETAYSSKLILQNTIEIPFKSQNFSYNSL